MYYHCYWEKSSTGTGYYRKRLKKTNECLSSLKSQNTNSAVQEPFVSDVQPSHARQPSQAAKLTEEKATFPACTYNSHSKSYKSQW